MRRHEYAMLPLVAAFAPLAGCMRPTHDPAELVSIRRAAEALMAAHASGRASFPLDLPRHRWPPAIARLRPETVTMYDWGVDVAVTPFFDGGWGYHVPRSGRHLPLPPGCYAQPGPGVFWHVPC